MVPHPILGVLERWRPRVEADELLTVRDVKKEDLGNIFRALGGELGLPYLGCGSSRAAFAISLDRVLKVGYSRCGMQSNRREVVAAGRLPQDLYAKVHSCAPDGLWLVQERVTAIEDWLGKGSYEEADCLRTEVEHAVPDGVCDAIPENFGRLPNGRLELIDIESLVPISTVLHPGEAVARRFAQM